MNSYRDVVYGCQVTSSDMSLSQTSRFQRLFLDVRQFEGHIFILSVFSFYLQLCLIKFRLNCKISSLEILANLDGSLYRIQSRCPFGLECVVIHGSSRSFSERRSCSVRPPGGAGDRGATRYRVQRPGRKTDVQTHLLQDRLSVRRAQ